MAEQAISGNLKRLADWEGRLAGLVAQRIDQPFAWGVNDCVLFAADCIGVMTGIDPVFDLRGQWADRKQALRVITRLGGLPAAVKARGFEEVQPLFAQRGDLVLHRRDRSDALAICLGSNLAGPSKSGLLFFGLESGVRAWRVG